jgi:hypothetical protein
MQRGPNQGLIQTLCQSCPGTIRRKFYYTYPPIYIILIPLYILYLSPYIYYTYPPIYIILIPLYTLYLSKRSARVALAQFDVSLYSSSCASSCASSLRATCHVYTCLHVYALTLYGGATDMRLHV